MIYPLMTSDDFLDQDSIIKYYDKLRRYLAYMTCLNIGIWKGDERSLGTFKEPLTSTNKRESQPKPIKSYLKAYKTYNEA